MLILALAPAAAAAAAEFPVRPLRLIVPYAPGGGGDTLARLLGERLAERLGQSVVVDNRPGGGTLIGSEIVARASADGHTLLLNTAAHTINPSLHDKLPYDTLRDFAAVILLADLPNALVVHPALPANSVAELIRHAKATPGLTYGSSGTGTAAHLAGELFRSMAGIDLTHVPYKGGAAVMPDLVAGRLGMTFATVPSSLPHVKAGRLKALAVASARRSAAMPELPTIAEAALPGYDASNWIGVLAPARTPPATVTRLNAEFRNVMHSPAVRERLPALGFETVAGSPQEFEHTIRAEIPKWRRVIQQSGAKRD
jgi:tripartite-type tricarboxylate transporter receptor subunit TctC